MAHVRLLVAHCPRACASQIAFYESDDHGKAAEPGRAEEFRALIADVGDTCPVCGSGAAELLIEDLPTPCETLEEAKAFAAAAITGQVAFEAAVAALGRRRGKATSN